LGCATGRTGIAVIPPMRPVLGFREAVAALPLGFGGDVKKFERAFATFAGQKYAFAFPYGRTGLALLLEAMDLNKQNIICPAYTCIVVPNSIVASGNTPVFVDIEEQGFNMDLSHPEAVIPENAGALVATSLFGYPVNLVDLQAIRDKFPKLKIIQDCAHSFLAQWDGRPVHKAGDAAIFSFNAGKTIHSVFGGMITTNQDDLAQKLSQLMDEKIENSSFGKIWRRGAYLAALYPAFWNYSTTHLAGRMGLLEAWTAHDDGEFISMPKDFLMGLTDLEARVGLVQLDQYAIISQKRKRSAVFYHEELKEVIGFREPLIFEGATYSHSVGTTTQRDDLIKYALSRGVQLGSLFDYSLPETKAYLGYTKEIRSYPVARRIAETVINLPCGSNRRAEEKTVKIVKKFFG